MVNGDGLNDGWFRQCKGFDCDGRSALSSERIDRGDVVEVLWALLRRSGS